MVSTAAVVNLVKYFADLLTGIKTLPTLGSRTAKEQNRTLILY